MPIHIVVCVKSVPSSAAIPVDPGTGLPKTAGVPAILNPFDEYAVEEAARLKERLPGSTATALTVGADVEVLREAAARGCDAGVQVAGPEFEGGDSLSSSAALAAAIKKLHADKPVHLVLFGKNASDEASGTVGSQTAAWLDWPGAAGVKKIEAADGASVTVHRMMEDGIDALSLSLPACLATVKEINEPRLPSLKGKMAAKKAVFPKWGAAELGLDPAQVGAAGAGTRLAKASPPPPRPAGVKVEGATAAEKAAKLVDLLLERKLI
ncbi:MAG: electron transfer flavoprotein subunit beta/FixA family protein [Elusimicrobia bacterium]|nr:electron transfer flavoprotein subunit beta/FixA family protein [Elusimicrobiota bacterium]